MGYRKGKSRWLITYVSGEKEEFMSQRKVREKVKEGNAVKVEKKETCYGTERRNKEGFCSSRSDRVV